MTRYRYRCLVAALVLSLAVFSPAWGAGQRPAGMNARGSTEVIVATIGLSLGVLSQDLFTMIVTMALVTTLLMPPTLRWALRRLPLQGEEKRRLEREAFEKKGFLPNMERLLIAVDESPNGKLASRVAGLLAGRKGMPVTVLGLPTTGDASTPEGLEHARFEDSRLIVQEAAEQAGRQDKEDEKQTPEVEVTGHIHSLPSAEAVETEAEKGYDLLVVGMEPATAPEGGFDGRLSEVAKGFEGSLAITVARGAMREDPLYQSMEILVPITGFSSPAESVPSSQAGNPAGSYSRRRIRSVPRNSTGTILTSGYPCQSLFFLGVSFCNLPVAFC